MHTYALLAAARPAASYVRTRRPQPLAQDSDVKMPRAQRPPSGTGATFSDEIDLTRLPGQVEIGTACLGMSSAKQQSWIGKLGELA
jgi:hypothetical protein